MLAFYGFTFVFGTPAGPIRALGNVWSTALLISASAGALATLSAPKRRDPDQSLVIEFWSCISLCTLCIWLEVSLFRYASDTGVYLINTAGVVMIFVVGFAARAIQIRRDRKDLRKFRTNGPIVK